MATQTVKKEHPNKIGVREGIGYMLGDGGNLFLLTYVSSYLKVFYTDVLKIPTSKVANLFLFTRLWDAINDPMWGAIVAKKKPNKDGKYRPYLLSMGIPTALISIAYVWFPYTKLYDWFPNVAYYQGETPVLWGYIAKLAVVLFFNLLLQFFFNFFNDAYTNLIHVLSPNVHFRP